MVAATMRAGVENGYTPLPRGETLRDHLRKHWMRIEEQEVHRHDEELAIPYSVGELIFGVTSAVGRTHSRLLEQRHKDRDIRSPNTRSYLLDLFSMASVDCMVATARMSKDSTAKAGEELLVFIDDLGIEGAHDLISFEELIGAASYPTIRLETIGEMMKNGAFAIPADVRLRGEPDEERVEAVTKELWQMAAHYYDLALPFFLRPEI